MSDLPKHIIDHRDTIGIAHTVELREYDPAYWEVFLGELSRILGHEPDSGLHLHHVGSTSIVGLCAKPIVDMLLIYTPDFGFDRVRTLLERIGYIFREDLLPDRTYFVLEDENGVRYCSISVFETWDPRSDDILAFRDNLRNDPALMEEYASIKRILADETADRTVYARKKSEFIRRHSKCVK